jgi:hypothetical protein
MPSRCLELYVYRLNLSGIVTLTSEWWEETSGNLNEYVKEEIACMEGGSPYRMIIQTKFYCGWEMGRSPSVNILNKEAISEEEYHELCLARRGVEDTPEYRRVKEEVRNLRNQLEDMVPICPACGARMVFKSGPYGDFWGCQRYPKCNRTSKISMQYKESERKILERIQELEASLPR